MHAHDQNGTESEPLWEPMSGRPYNNNNNKKAKHSEKPACLQPMVNTGNSKPSTWPPAPANTCRPHLKVVEPVIGTCMCHAGQVGGNAKREQIRRGSTAHSLNTCMCTSRELSGELMAIQ